MASSRYDRKVIREPRKAPRRAGRKDVRQPPNYQEDRDGGVIGDYRPDPAPPSSTSGGLIGGYGPPK